MSRASWIAIIMAIAFPSVALLVILLTRSERPPPPEHPRMGHPSPHKQDIPMPHKGDGHPPHFRGGPPPPFEEELLRLRKQLELTEEQVDQIWKLGQPARREMSELRFSIDEQEATLHGLLRQDEVNEEETIQCLEELHRLRLRMDTVKVLTPIRLKKVLTEGQREKLMDLWRVQRAKRGGQEHPGLMKGPLGPPHRGEPWMKGPPPFDGPPRFEKGSGHKFPPFPPAKRRGPPPLLNGHDEGHPRIDGGQ